MRIGGCRFPRSRVPRPLPRHPAQHATNGMAGLLARGSMQLAAFPTCRLRTEISGFGQALAAYSCGGSRGFVSQRSRRSTRTTFPHRSFLRKRPSRALVQRCAVALSMARSRRLLSPPGRCITLAALSGARPSIGLASETGSRCERVIAAPSRHCPRNGKRIKANTHVTAPVKGVGRHSPATGIRESGDRPGIEQRIPSRWANWAM